MSVKLKSVLYLLEHLQTRDKTQRSAPPNQESYFSHPSVSPDTKEKNSQSASQVLDHLISCVCQTVDAYGASHSFHSDSFGLL